MYTLDAPVSQPDASGWGHSIDVVNIRFKETLLFGVDHNMRELTVISSTSLPASLLEFLDTTLNYWLSRYTWITPWKQRSSSDAGLLVSEHVLRRLRNRMRVLRFWLSTILKIQTASAGGLSFFYGLCGRFCHKRWFSHFSPEATISMTGSLL